MVKSETLLMSVDLAAKRLAAIGNPVRLRIYRVLIKAGPEGKAAGEVAECLEIAPSSLSFHLKEMIHAGLIHARQQGRYVIYTVVFEAMDELLRFLVHDCCEGNSCQIMTWNTDICEPK